MYTRKNVVKDIINIVIGLAIGFLILGPILSHFK